MHGTIGISYGERKREKEREREREREREQLTACTHHPNAVLIALEVLEVAPGPVREAWQYVVIVVVVVVVVVAVVVVIVSLL